MDPRVELAALKTEAAPLATKAQAGTLTEQEADRVGEIVKRMGELETLIQKQDNAAKALAGLNLAEKSDDDAAGGGDGGQGGGSSRTPGDGGGGGGEPRAKSWGEAFVTSKAYQGFKEANPNFSVDAAAKSGSEAAPIHIKAAGIVAKDALATTTTGNARAVRIADVIDLTYRQLPTLLDLITRGTTNLPWFQYRQIITKVNNASIVAEAVNTAGVGVTGGVKPLSTLTTATAEAKAYTYADGMEVTNQELSDDGIIRTLIDSTLRENLDLELEDVLLNGLGNANEPAGIMTTTGVLQQAFVTDVPTTVRKAITKLRVTSGTQVQAIVFHPTDDEAWDLLKDTQNRYLGNGPFGAGPTTAWGYARITSQKLPVGTALAGDFRVVQLLILEALTILAFNQHKDYAQRNLTYIRAELRAVQLIRQPSKLCVIDLTAA